MAQIPLVESTRVTPAASPGALISPEAAAAPYRALQGFGQSIREVGSVVQEFQLKKQKAQDDAAILNAEIEWDKAAAEYDTWRQSNPDAGVSGEKHVQKAQEIANRAISTIQADTTMSADARRVLQGQNSLRMARFIDGAKVAANEQAIKQAKARHMGVIEYWTERGDRQQIAKSIQNLVDNGLETPEGGEAMLKSALRNADLNEFNRAVTSGDILALHDMQEDLDQDVLSYLTPKDKRQAQIMLREQINRVQTQTANDLAMELEDEGASAAWRQKFDVAKENGALNASAAKMLDKRAAKDVSTIDVASYSIEINTQLDAISKSEMSDNDKERALFQIGPSIAALPSGPNKSLLEQKYKDVLKPEKAKKSWQDQYLDNEYDIGSFGAKSVTTAYKMKNGKKTDEVDEALTQQRRKEASDAHFSYVQAKEWLKANPNATREQIDAVIRQPRDISGLNITVSAISGF